MSDKPIGQVQAEHTMPWMRIPGVVCSAIGLHEGRPCILIMASVDPDWIQPQIPRGMEGYPVVIEKTGDFAHRTCREPDKQSLPSWTCQASI